MSQDRRDDATGSRPRAQIPRHGIHFRTEEPPPEAADIRIDGVEIIEWEVFLLDGEPTPIYAPVTACEGAVLHGSSRARCFSCRMWIDYGGSISHYRQHAYRHRMKRDGPDPGADHEPTTAVISFLLARGEPLSSMEFLRHTDLRRHVPSEVVLDTVRRVVRCRLDDRLRELCLSSDAVNLAVDGWTDPRGRRYEGVTVQLISHVSLTATTAVLALKEIKGVHQNSAELRVAVERIQARFGIAEKTITVCTDRAAMNERAFRGDLAQRFFEGTFWLPCVCHFLNNLLGRFLHNIPDVVAPIFKLQQRFRKHGPFMSFLESRNVRAQAIPSYSTVRWYSSNAVFSALLRLWDHMVAFAQQEHLTVDELDEQVKANTEMLAQLTGRFADAQKGLESDELGVGSRFIGTLLSVTHCVEKLEEQQPTAVQGFRTQVEDFKGRYPQEYHLLLLMTYLDPSVQFVIGRTCSEAEYSEMITTLTALVTAQIVRDVQGEADAAAEPDSDDFYTFRSTSQTEAASATDQISLYSQIRAVHFHSRSFWLTVRPELQQLTKVAIRTLSALTTSASVERAFSVARAICGDYQMAMTQETIACRVMLRANWGLVEPLVGEAVAMAPWARGQVLRNHQRGWEDTTWRLDLPDVADTD
jgi:hypothetical protein